MTYHIEDWASNAEKFNGKRFDTFEDARDFISTIATQEADKKFPMMADTDEWLELYDGICDDLYAIEDITESEE